PERRPAPGAYHPAPDEGHRGRAAVGIDVQAPAAPPADEKPQQSRELGSVDRTEQNGAPGAAGVLHPTSSGPEAGGLPTTLPSPPGADDSTSATVFLAAPWPRPRSAGRRCPRRRGPGRWPKAPGRGRPAQPARPARPRPGTRGERRPPPGAPA